MRISANRIKELCRGRRLRLKELLHELLHHAGVSRTAYYSLLRKDSVLPRSIMNMAEYLNISPAEFLDDEGEKVRSMRLLQEEAAGICRRHPDCDADNIRHTLLLLNQKPVNRLRRGLTRAQKCDFHG